MILATGAQVVAEYLKAQGLIQGTNQANDWWYTIGMKVTLPDNTVTFYDTAGVLDGRLMQGEYIHHPGLQIMVRGKPYVKGWQQIQRILNSLSVVNWLNVTVGSEVVRFVSFTMTSTPTHLGQEQDNIDRNLFSMNGTVTLQPGGS